MLGNGQKHWENRCTLCPVKMHQILEKTFLLDTRHYEFPNISTTDILLKLKQAYLQQGWISIERYDKNGTVPYAYAIPKFKDVTRFRPIVSYCTQPLRRVDSVAQRALVFLLKEVPLQHYTLWQTHNFLTRLSEMKETLIQSAGEGASLELAQFDVREMFTDLPHESILSAVTTILDLAPTCSRSHYVRVPKDSSIPCSFGKSCNLHDTKHISFAQILKVISFHLENAFLTVGIHILRQIDGSPIGGSSPQRWLLRSVLYLRTIGT